jgi:hypothetical protein
LGKSLIQEPREWFIGIVQPTMMRLVTWVEIIKLNNDSNHDNLETYK